MTGNPESKRQRHVWVWIVASAALLILLLMVAGELTIRRAGPILKSRIEEALRARFHGRVEIGSLDVSLFRGLEVSGDHLRIYAPGNPDKPLIAVDNFSFHSGMRGLFLKPMHVEEVRVAGLDIEVPPRNAQESSADAKKRDKITIAVDKIVCDNSRLVINTSNPSKDPRDFELKHIVLRDFGPNAPWKFDAVLVNAIPRGDIRSSGTFGPWQVDNPGDSPVSGHYTFDHADLNPIRGIGGILSSVGQFHGKLDQIVVDGTTDTPDFSLDTTNHRMPLHTRFHAIVDGITGDTYLQPVAAKLRNSDFTATGAVINIKGQGHQIELNVDIPNAQLRDFLELAVNTQPPALTAIIGAKMKLNIPPGKESVPRKLSLEGPFTLRRIHFTNPAVQDKVDMLSLRAQGDPQDAKPGAKDVNSWMKGTLDMARGELRFSNIEYSLPGAEVDLTGVYSLDGEEFNFRGKVLTDASLPQMVASRWKSLLLVPVSPFFHRKGGGAEIPVSISGTRSAPKFGLNLFGHHGRDETAQAGARP